MSTIFFFIGITMIWYLPGLIIKTWKEGKAEIKAKNKALEKAKSQAEAISRLYPKNDQD